MKTTIDRWLAALLWLYLVQAAQAYYNPSTGRWLSRDPIVEKAFLDLSSHRELRLHSGVLEFVFVHNNAVSYVDVLGLSERDVDTITRQFVQVLKDMCKQKRCCPELGLLQNPMACAPAWLSPQQGCTTLAEDLQDAMYETIYGKGGLDDKWNMAAEQVTICWPVKHNYVVVKPVGGHDLGREIKLDLWKGCYTIRQFHSIPIPPFGYFTYWSEDKHCFTCKAFQK